MEQRGYWDSFYSKFAEDSASPFCTYVINQLTRGSDTVVELGCGNGRDGLALAANVANYIGIDASLSAVEAARGLLMEHHLLGRGSRVEQGDFSAFDFNEIQASRLVVYSRFSLHADSDIAESALLGNLESCQHDELLVCVEARTIHDELYGQGREVGRHTFITDHARRFIDPEEFRVKVESHFSIKSFEVSRGFAPYRNENPMVMRVVFGWD